MNKKRSWLFDELVVQSWWTILFFLICLFVHDQADKRREHEEEKLQKKFDQLLMARQDALLHQEELKREIASEKDALSIELILMQRLGLVPEGQTKVVFSSRR